MQVFSHEHPMKVFVFGSSTIDMLTAEMLDALYELINTYHPEFLVGDCYGADNLVQAFLEDIDYPNVRIFCSGKEPRHAHFANVVSLWKDSGGKRGEEFQQVKDVSMTEECDIAIGFWDGTSRGTKANIDRCKKLGKPCKVFLAPLFQKSKETNPTNFV